MKNKPKYVSAETLKKLGFEKFHNGSNWWQHRNNRDMQICSHELTWSNLYMIIYNKAYKQGKQAAIQNIKEALEIS